MMKKTLWWVSLTLLFLGFSTLYGQQRQAVLEGKVITRDNAEPLSGVNLMLYNAGDQSSPIGTTITNMDGQYRFKGLSRGEYVLVASHVGHQRVRRTLTVDQAGKQVDITMQSQNIDLGEVIVTSLHQQQRVKEVSMPMEVMDEADISRLAAFSPSQALAAEPGITLQNDGVWATSVNIRGMSEQRIVTLVDGNRIETATDLAAGLSMVDMSDLQRVEVIKGAASSIYGTGAMGGVVNFITKSGTFAGEAYTRGTLSSSFHSVNDMLFRKLSISTGADYGYIRINGMQRNASDINTPRGTLENSQFTDHSLSLDAGIKPLENHTLEIQLHRFLARDVGIPGGAPFPGPAKATYPKERRNLYSATYQITDITPALSELSFKYYHQYILRDVKLLPNAPAQQAGNFRITPQKITPQGQHYTDGLKLKSDWQLFNGHQVTAGIDLWQRRLRTQRQKYIQRETLNDQGQPVDTTQIIRGEKPIPDSRFQSAGIFVQDRFALLNDQLKITVGGRYDLLGIHNNRALDPHYLIVDGQKNPNPPNQRITFEQRDVSNKSWSADLGFVYQLTRVLDVTLSMGHSFRSPSLEERYKYIDLGNKVRIGDPDLKPEKGYNLDAGFRVWHPDINLRVNGFVNRFRDLIVEQPGEYIYTYSTGPLAGTRDTLPALINSNVSQALYYGVDLKFDISLLPSLVWHGSMSLVRGRDTKNKEHLPLIPPLNGTIGFKYTLPGSITMDLYSEWAADQDKVAPGESPTPGYAIVNFRAHSKPINLNFARLSLSGGVNNIFNKAYQNHLSTNRGIIQTEPGRNLYIKMQLHF